jgi:hypothetical protein
LLSGEIHPLHEHLSSIIGREGAGHGPKVHISLPFGVCSASFLEEFFSETADNFEGEEPGQIGANLDPAALGHTYNRIGTSPDGATPTGQEGAFSSYSVTR